MAIDQSRMPAKAGIQGCARNSPLDTRRGGNDAKD